MKNYADGKQPCAEFEPAEVQGGVVLEHVCPKCGKLRAFCSNCCTDHHEHGWEECWKLEQPR